MFYCSGNEEKVCMSVNLCIQLSRIKYHLHRSIPYPRVVDRNVVSPFHSFEKLLA